MMAEDGTLPLDKIKKEPEDSISDDFESIDYSFSEEDVSVKCEQIEKDTGDTVKSDDDMQGYDTRSEVASSVTSDSDSGDTFSSKSFDVKRKRHSKGTSSRAASSHGTSRKNDVASPLKTNSEEYISKLNYLFRDARFFIIKSSNSENIALSKAKGVWATLPQNQVKLSEAFRTSQNVILIFSAKESGKFSGFARLATCVDGSISPVHWVVPAELTLNLLKGTFRIDWICRKDLPFTFTASLYNPWNYNKPVKIARDGQEVESRVGEKLCRLFPEDDSVDIAPILRKSKEAAKTKGPKNAYDIGKALYTAKYRAKMLQYHRNPKDRKQFPHRLQDGERFSKPYKRGIGPKNFADGAKDRPVRGGVVTSIEMCVKQFGHAVRPPMPMSLPFLPPLPPGSKVFPPQFGLMPFLQPPHLPRYYEPVPSFPHFAKMNPMYPMGKHMYNRSVKEFIHKTREKDYYAKKENHSNRKDNDGRGRRAHYRERH